MFFVRTLILNENFIYILLFFDICKSMVYIIALPILIIGYLIVTLSHSLTLLSCQCVSLAAIWVLRAYLILWAVATPTTYDWTYSMSFVVVSLVAFAVCCRCRYCRCCCCCCCWGTSRASGFDRRTALQVWVELKAKSTFTESESSALKCRKFGASGMSCVLQLQLL